MVERVRLKPELKCEVCESPTKLRVKFEDENHRPYLGGLCDGCLCDLGYDEFAYYLRCRMRKNVA